MYPPGGIVFLASLLSGGVLEKNGGNPLVEMTGTALKKSGKCQLMIDDASFMRLAADSLFLPLFLPPIESCGTSLHTQNYMRYT